MLLSTKNAQFLYGFYFFLSLIFFYSCGSNNAAEKENELNDLSDTKRNVFIADASEILPGWSTENIIVNHVVGEPDHLHPFNSVNATKTWIHNYIHRFLLRSDLINLEVIPDLVTSMPDSSADGLIFTYTLRNDITWDDGSAITVEDVIFSYKACALPLTNNPNFKSYIGQIKNVTADPNDPMKVILTMKEIWIQNVIITADVPIIQRNFYDPNKVLDKYTFAQFEDPNFSSNASKELLDWSNDFNNIAKYGNDPSFIKGAGPYQVKEWTRGQTLTLEKKKDHWTSKLKNPNPYEAAFPETIIFKIIQDDNAAKLELAAQTIDVSSWLTTASMIAMQKDSSFNLNYNSKFIYQYGYNYLAMNMKPDGIKHKNIFDDLKVRKAMAYLTPVDEIIEVIALGKASRQTSITSTLKPEYNQDLVAIPFDVEAAKKLLDEAGWIDSDGDNIRDKIINGEKTALEFSFSYMTTQKFVGDLAKMCADAMYLAGAKVNLTPMDPNLLYESVRQHDFDMMMGTWASSSYPEDFSQLWHTNAWANFGSNFTGFGSAESDALIDSIKVTLDTEKRYEMSRRLQKIVYDEQPYIFLYSSYKKMAIHKRFGNQYLTFERPGLVLNYYKLLSLYGSSSIAQQHATMY